MEATLIAQAPSVSRQRTHSQLVKRIKKFRLQTASVILGNHRYTKQIQNDADYRANVFDLCDQYCLCIFMNWIATKYGFPICASTIEEDLGSALMPLQTWCDIADLYPLNLPVLEPEWVKAAKSLFGALDESFAPKLEVLGELYQNIISSTLHLADNQQIDIQTNDDGRQAGEFYTPSDVVIYCLDRVLEKDSLGLMNRIKQSMAYAGDGNSDEVTDTDHNRLKPQKACLEPNPAQCTTPGEGSFKLIDPACGTGNFLIGAVHWLRKQLSDTLAPQTFITQSVYGRDIDGRAVDICRLSLLLLCDFQTDKVQPQRHPPSRLPCVGTLERGSPASFGDEILNASDQDSPAQSCDDKVRLQSLIAAIRSNIRVENCVLTNMASRDDNDKFDLVVGNPPYVSYGSRNQPKLSPDWQRFLRASFPHSTEYKIRLYSVFQELSLRLAKPGGCISLLVPDAFLNGSFYQKLRALILRDAEILSLSELPRDSIPCAVVGNWCVACYQKRTLEVASATSTVQLYRVTKDRTQSYQLAGDLFVSRDKNRFQLVFTEQDAKLLQLIRYLQPLSTELKGHTGIRSRVGQASIVSTSRGTQAHKAGITSGSRIQRHRVAGADAWIEIDPSKLFAGGFDHKIIEPPKIMMRQTADRIIAALDESGLYHLNNVHSFAPARSGSASTHRLFYLCGLLNSQFYLHLYRLKSREEGRALAQIDIEMVEAMPVPQQNEQLQGQIAQAAQRLQSEHLDDGEALFLDREIDLLTYKLFELSDDLILHIEQQMPTAANSATTL